MPRWRHSSTSYFGGSHSYLTNFSLEGEGKTGIGEHRLEDGLQALVGPAAVRLHHQQELVVGRLLNLDEVRHLRDFFDFSEKLPYALPTDKRLRHHVLSLNRSGLEPPCSSHNARTHWTGIQEFEVPRRSRRLSERPQSIATVRTGVICPILQ